MRANVEMNRTSNPQRDELRRLGREIETLCTRIADLKIKRSDMDRELRQVKVVFFEHVGPLYIDKMQRDLAYRRLRRRVELILEGMKSNADIEARLDREFGREQAEVEKLAGEQENLFEEKAIVEEMAQIDPDLKHALRQLYLDMARKFHPDRFTDPEARAQAEEVMKAVNEYYESHDLQGMLELQQKVGLELFHDPSEAMEARIHRAKLMRAKLRQTAAQLESDIEQLKQGQLYQIKLQMEAAQAEERDAIAALTTQLRREIQDIKVKDAVLRRRLANLAGEKGEVE
jgi:hypothetical protein